MEPRGPRVRGGRGSTPLRGERGCAPDRCRAPQNGNTPLHGAAISGHSAVLEKLLAAGAAKDAPDEVRGGVRHADRELSRGNTHMYVSSLFAFCGKAQVMFSSHFQTPSAPFCWKLALKLCWRDSPLAP